MDARSVTGRLPSRSTKAPARGDWRRRLILANLALFVLLLLHDLDHVVRQREPTTGPGGVPLYAWAVSVAGYVGVLVVAWLAARGDRRAAPLTQVIGLAFAAGFFLAHVLPWSPGSYWAYGPGLISWALVVAPIAAGLLAAAIGERARAAAPPAEQRP